MRLVVDANILVAELIRKRGRELIVRPELELYIAEQAWSETHYELSKRVTKMVQNGVFDQESGEKLLVNAIALAEARVSLVPHEVYASLETIAKDRIPRDPDDWFTIALALEKLQFGLQTQIFWDVDYRLGLPIHFYYIFSPSKSKSLAIFMLWQSDRENLCIVGYTCLV